MSVHYNHNNSSLTGNYRFKQVGVFSKRIAIEVEVKVGYIENFGPYIDGGMTKIWRELEMGDLNKIKIELKD
jgi:hypothetical protein